MIRMGEDCEDCAVPEERTFALSERKTKTVKAKGGKRSYLEGGRKGVDLMEYKKWESIVGGV